MIDRSEILSRSQVQFITLLCCAPFTSHGKVHEFGAEKPISWVKLAHFNFLAISFIVWSHILCTGSGDALTHSLTHDFGIDFVFIISLWGNVVVVGYLLSIRGLAWLGADRGKRNLDTKVKKGCRFYDKNKIIFALVWNYLFSKKKKRKKKEKRKKEKKKKEKKEFGKPRFVTIIVK